LESRCRKFLVNQTVAWNLQLLGSAHPTAVLALYKGFSLPSRG
jgi:hypothetical protein